MCAFQLSPEQRAAVENRGGTLLVSAAAGSGKTRVLVERLFRYIVEDRADVDDFLIITFTRAAASELRGRIVEELNKRLAVTPGDSHLRRQLLRVYQAEIKTIDAFCSGILRENVHLLEEDARGGRLTADFRTLDENEAAPLRERTLQRVLENYYESREASGGSLLLADTFGYGRSDDGLAALIQELYNKIQSHAYPLRWLQETRKMWEDLPDDPAEMLYGRELLQRFGERAAFWAKKLRRTVEQYFDVPAITKAYSEQFLEAAVQLEELAALAEAGKWAEIGRFPLAYRNLGRVTDQSVAEEKEAAQAVWKGCKEAMKKEKALFEVLPEDYLGDMRAMAPAIVDLLDLTEKFSRCYQEEKVRRNVADFSDQEHHAIVLLTNEDGTPTALGETVSARYLEIMVDEYQDTNEVQNRIFSAVSKDQKNLFVVGDVKQSIYRFRLADPGIFLKKYREFSFYPEAGEGEPRKLLLSKNYRSRREVLDATNFIFENILSLRMGEMEYGADERLYAGNEGFAERTGCETEFHLVSLPRRQEDSFKKVKKQDAEARFVAERIRTLLREGFPVQGENGLRPVQPEDIVILMRSPGTRMKEFTEALESRGIPYSAEGVTDFFSTVEIAVTYQLLQLIDNPRQDVPLISVLSSPLFGFTPDRLAEIRSVSPDTDFYEALLSAEGEDVKHFLARLQALREGAKDRSVRRILSFLYDEWNLPGVFGAMDGGSLRRENLFALLEHAERFEKSGYRGLFAFLAELRQQLEQGKAPVTAGKAASGGVRIMSIHKSKGLEFPVVILADLAHSFNRQDFSEPVLVHPQLGLGPLCIDLARRIRFPTLARLAIENRMKREMKAEEMRILYVAMTRAKEKLILVHSALNADKYIGKLAPLAASPVDPEVVEDRGCLGEWILLPLLTRPESAPLKDLAGCSAVAVGAAPAYPWKVLCHDGLSFEKRQTAGDAGEEASAEPELPLELMDFVYPYERETLLPTVVSPSQLKTAVQEGEESTLPPHIRGIRRPAFLEGAQALTGAEAGTATHLLMQFLDFSCEGTEFAVRSEIARLQTARRISSAQAGVIRVGEVAALLRSDMGKRLRENELHREYRLALLMEAKELDAAAAEGEQIMLHGVIDCWFEKPDGTVAVLDFKTDRVHGEKLQRRAEEYRPQVEMYCKALERILGKNVSEKLLYFFSEGTVIVL